MSIYSNNNPLLMKRIKTSFSKTNNNNKKKKDYDKSLNDTQNDLKFNFSMDVKNFMVKDKSLDKRNSVGNTINFEQQSYPEKRNNSFMFSRSKRKNQSTNLANVKLAYGVIPSTTKPSLSNFHSQKSIKQKRKRLSLTPSSGGARSYIVSSGVQTPSNIVPNMPLKAKNQTITLQKQIILSKCEKIKQLLKQQKYSQATVYLKQVIPFIEEKQKKKQFYFWLVTAMLKHSTYNSEVVQGYIIDCLEQFPNYFDMYLHWAKVKAKQSKLQQAIYIFQKAIKINQTVSEGYLELSNLLIQNNQLQQAFKYLQQGFAKAIKSNSIPTKIVQNYEKFNLSVESLQNYVLRIEANLGKKNSDYLYVKGLVQKFKGHQSQALIDFLESLKYNTSKNSSTKSLQNLIQIHIRKRDFYAAYYEIKRSKHLNIDFLKLVKYENFLEGVNFVMKKQYEQGIKYLQQIIKTNFQIKKSLKSYINKTKETEKNNWELSLQILSLVIKYLAYAYFKLGNHSETIKCYKILQNYNEELDKVSKYNLLLAEGIVYSDSEQKFELAIQKFELAKTILSKVEPWIYHSMALVQQQLFRINRDKKIKSLKQKQIQQNLRVAIQEALVLMDQGNLVNSSSSNLLYHKCIFNLFLLNLPSALQDINTCIEKAEENLPKYFYLRGLCYACQKNMKKAINQFSIAISLNKAYSIAYLQRAKCYFLIGQTQMGFYDLKIYMEQQEQDINVHKWIGDLLFEGTSYHDAIKAYNQMGKQISIEGLSMRFKAEMRIGSLKKLQQTMNDIQSHSDFNEQVFALDIAAYQLMLTLTSNSSVNKIEKQLKKLNEQIQKESSQKGKLFHLVDCMNLIGVTNFYLQRFTQAYQSFLLISQFYKETKGQIKLQRKYQQNQQNTQKKQFVSPDKINVEIQQDSQDLKQQDAYYNIFICLLAIGDRQQMKRFINEEMLSIITDKTQLKVIKKISLFLQSKKQKKKQAKKQNIPFVLEPRVNSPIGHHLKKFELSINLPEGNNLIVKTGLVWTPFHSSVQDLSFISYAKKLVYKLHAGYIDNMPEGPWIKRNQFGVIFTDNILQGQNQTSFILTTNRNDKEIEYEDDQQEYKNEFTDPLGIDEQKSCNQDDDINNKKKAFLKEMKLDLKIQKKLKKIINQSSLQ